MCCQYWSPICDLINLSFGLTTYYLLFWLTIYSFEWFWFDRNSWTGRCYAIQTGKRLRLRKWKEFHRMAWSLGNESIGLFKSSLLVCQKFWQMFKLVFFLLEFVSSLLHCGLKKLSDIALENFSIFVFCTFSSHDILALWS